MVLHAHLALFHACGFHFSTVLHVAAVVHFTLIVLTAILGHLGLALGHAHAVGHPGAAIRVLLAFEFLHDIFVDVLFPLLTFSRFRLFSEKHASLVLDEAGSAGLGAAHHFARAVHA